MCECCAPRAAAIERESQPEPHLRSNLHWQTVRQSDAVSAGRLVALLPKQQQLVCAAPAPLWHARAIATKPGGARGGEDSGGAHRPRIRLRRKLRGNARHSPSTVSGAQALRNTPRFSSVSGECVRTHGDDDAEEHCADPREATDFG